MTVPQKLKRNLFERALSAFAMLGPLVLLGVASAQSPDGQQGNTVVSGLTLIVYCLLAALVLRGAYEMGVTHARKFFDSGSDRRLHT